MIRNRITGILVRDNKILLIHRINNGKEYYVFPGGGQEEGETREEALKREILEETSIEVQAEKLVYILRSNNENNYFYFCKASRKKAEFDKDSPEYKRMENDEQSYVLVWIPIESIDTLDLYPFDARDLLFIHLQTVIS